MWFPCTLRLPFWIMPGNFLAGGVYDIAVQGDVGHLSCRQLEEYEWAWYQAGSGEYEANAPIFSVYPAVIYLPEVNEVCPDFSP